MRNDGQRPQEFRTTVLGSRFSQFGPSMSYAECVRGSSPSIAVGLLEKRLDCSAPMHGESHVDDLCCYGTTAEHLPQPFASLRRSWGVPPTTFGCRSESSPDLDLCEQLLSPQGTSCIHSCDHTALSCMVQSYPNPAGTGSLSMSSRTGLLRPLIPTSLPRTARGCGPPWWRGH